MARIVAGVDPGRTGARFLLLKARGEGVAVAAYRVAGRGVSSLPLEGHRCVVGIGGREVILRYAQVPPVPDWQLRNLVAFEVKEIAGASREELCADFNLLPGSSELTGEDTVLIALVRSAVAEERLREVQAAGGKLAALVPGPVALLNAVLLAGETREGETLLAANLGHETIDVVLMRGGDILFARNLSGGGKVIDEAIAQAFNVKPERAERIKREFANVDPGARDRYASNQEEKVSRAVLGAAGQLVSALRSTVAFCQSQTGLKDLKVDRILVSGGTSRLKGIRQLLTEHFRCPVDRLDPFAGSAVDLSALPPEEGELLAAEGPQAVLALGLAAGALRDDLYQLEILPDRLRRRREFLQGPLFAWLAAGAALLVLLILFLRGSARWQELDGVRQELQRQANAVAQVDNNAADLARDCANLQAAIASLEDLGGRGAAVLRTWQALASTLPPEFWVKSIAVNRGRAAGDLPKGTEPPPVVTVKGLGQETGQQEVSHELIFTPFLEGFQKALEGPIPRGRILARELDPVTRAQLFAFEVTLDFFPPPPPAAGAK